MPRRSRPYSPVGATAAREELFASALNPCSDSGVVSTHHRQVLLESKNTTARTPGMPRSALAAWVYQARLREGSAGSSVVPVSATISGLCRAIPQL